MQGFLIALAIILLLINLGVTLAGVWASFEKARRPGWSCLIPIWNTLIIIDIAGKPWWWIFLLFIPVVSIVFVVMIWYNFVISYGKGVGFLLGLLFLPFVFWPMLGFDDSEYQQHWG